MEAEAATEQMKTCMAKVEERAAFLGHKLGLWKYWLYGIKVECNQCEATARVSINSFNGKIEIAIDSTACIGQCIIDQHRVNQYQRQQQRLQEETAEATQMQGVQQVKRGFWSTLFRGSVR